MRSARFLAPALLLFAASPLHAASWELDLLSFFRFPGSEKTQQIAGGVIPVEVGFGLLGSWSLRVRAADVKFEPMVVGPEEILDLALASDGAGELRVKGGQVHATLNLALSVRRRGYGEAVVVPLAFTTETATSHFSKEATLTGVAFDPASGFFQLVATGAEPFTRPPRVPEAFQVVLSGRLRQIPSSLANARP